MAELQTLTAAINLVQVIGETVGFIDKVAKARQEAVALYKKVQRLDKLLKSIKSFLESREQDPSRGSLALAEESVEVTIKESLDECRKCLEITNHELEPLTKVPRGQISGIANRLKWVFTDKFIKNQERQVESYFQSLSISLHLLQNYTHRASQKATEELIEQQKNTQRLLVKLVTDIHQYGTEIQPSTSNPSRPESDRLLLRKELSEVLNDALAERPASEHETESKPEDDADDEAEDTIQRYDTSDDDETSALDTALRIAVKHNQDEIVRGLRQSGADVRMRDSENLTLLHFAVLQNAEKALIALLDTEPEPEPEWLDAQSKRGLTALMYAPMLSDPDEYVILARTLISNGCSVNIQDGEGRSAICFAIDGGPPSVERKDLVKLLLDNHADPEPAFKWSEEQARRYTDLEERFSAVHQRKSVSHSTEDS